MKLANDEEKACWIAAIQSAPDFSDDEGNPLDTPEQVSVAAEYADLVVEEYRKRV